MSFNPSRTLPRNSIPIPVHFVSETNQSTTTRSYRDDFFSRRFSNNSPRFSRFQKRPSPGDAYDRLMENSHYDINRPTEFQRFGQSTRLFSSRSNEDLLDRHQTSETFDNENPLNSRRRSFDVLNDDSDQPKATSSTRSDGPEPTEPTSTSTPATVQIDPNQKALEKIEDIQKSLIKFSEQVESFDGFSREDRQYKELDEQAIKLMMRCDELIDVSADIKEKRREMIRNIQTILTKLESKAPHNPKSNENSNLAQASSSSTTTTTTTTTTIETTASSAPTIDPTDVEH